MSKHNDNALFVVVQEEKIPYYGFNLQNGYKKQNYWFTFIPMCF